MSRRAKDIAGQTFGRLTAVSFSHIDKAGNARWLCRCACGAEMIARGDKLRSGRTKSCGCKLSAQMRAFHRRRDEAERAKKAMEATPSPIDGFAPEEASAIEAFIAAGKVKVIRQGEWPDELSPGRPRFIDFRRGA